MTDIAKEYAAALFMLAREQDKVNPFTDGLDIINTAFKQNNDYLLLLASPNIPLSQRLEALNQAFSKEVDEYVLSFVQLLCEKGKIYCFFDAVKEYKALKASFEHISKVKISSAAALSDDQKAELIKKLEQAYSIKAQAQYEIDPTLIGGLIIEIDGKIINSSLRQRLREIKDVIGV